MTACFDENTAVEFVEGGLSTARAQAVRDHIDVCASCRSLIADATRMGAGTAGASTVRFRRERQADASGEVPSPPGGEQAALGRNDRIGNYVVRELIGQGGMAQVYAALDPELQREVAVKLPRKSGDQGELKARLRREARALARLAHPNIVPVYELGQTRDGTPYYVMRRLEGRSMASALRDCRTLADRLTLLGPFLGVCQAVAYAHEQRILHRDIKPENVMLGDLGEALLVDWGLARMDRAEDAAGRTPGGTTMGTPSYLSPEQAAGDREAIDERADVWSLGAVLYEILTGRPPFVGGDTMAVVMQVLTRPVAPVRSLCPEAPVALAAVCEKAMARERAGRYRNAKDLWREVEAYVTGAAMRGRRARMFRVGPVILAAALAVVSAGATFAVLGLYRAAARAEAAQEALVAAELNAAQVAIDHGGGREALGLVQSALDLRDTPRGRALAARGLWAAGVEAGGPAREAEPLSAALLVTSTVDGRAIGLGRRGWRDLLDGAPLRLPDAAWRRAAAQASHAGAAYGHVCLTRSGGPVELWEVSADARRASFEVAGLRDVAAAPKGCLVLGERASLVSGSNRVDLCGPASAVGAGENALAAACGEELALFTVDGEETSRRAIGPGASAVLVTAGGAYAGFHDGGILRVSAAGGPPLPFGGTPAAPVTRLAEVTAGVLAAAYGSGQVGLWSTTSGERLDLMQLDGAVSHLRRIGRHLFAQSERGQTLALDVTVFERDLCGVLNELWRFYPPPVSHPCRAQAGDVVP